MLLFYVDVINHAYIKLMLIVKDDKTVNNVDMMILIFTPLMFIM